MLEEVLEVLMFKLPSSNPYCTMCSLGKGNTGKQRAIFGQSNCAPKNIALAVVSAYPGGEEIAQDLSLAPEREPPKHNETAYRRYIENKNQLKMGAGAFLRLCLRNVFDNDPNFPSYLKPIEDFIFFTNAIKCSPTIGKQARKFGDREINTCSSWLMEELNHCPDTIPILIASTQARKALLPELNGLYELRRKVYYWKQHPCLITMNPIEAERGTLKEIVESTEVKGVIVASKLRYSPLLPMSVPWHFHKDLQLIKKLVIEYDQKAGRKI